MKLLIDDANVQEIRRLCDLYPIDGVTTNPSILAKTGRNPAEVLREIRDIIGPGKLLFAQAIPTDAEGMVRDARAIVKLLGAGTVVKVPSIPEGFKAIRMMKEEGISSCGAVVYTPLQAYLAAKAGAALCAYGIGSATCAPAVIDAFVKNPAIDGAVGDFIRDFTGLTGEGKSMADLIG